MTTSAEVQEAIQESNWPDQQKQELLSMLPKLGPAVLQYIFDEVSRADSVMIADNILQSFQSFVGIIDRLKAGDPKPLSDVILGKSSLGFDYRTYVMPFIVDAKLELTSGRMKPVANILDMILQFELDNFYRLPAEEIFELLRQNLFFFMERTNFLMDLKAFYLRKPILETLDWSTKWLQALRQNQEKIGTTDLNFDRRNYPPTMENWLRDYQLFVATSKLQGSVAEVQYILKSANVKLLDQRQKKFLSAAIKLEDWLVDPRVNLAEVEEYEKAKEEPGSSAPVAPAASSLDGLVKPAGLPHLDKPLNIQDILSNRQGRGGLQATDGSKTAQTPAPTVAPAPLRIPLTSPPPSPPPVPMPKPAVAQTPVVVQKPVADISAELEKLRQRKTKK